MILHDSHVYANDAYQEACEDRMRQEAEIYAEQAWLRDAEAGDDQSRAEEDEARSRAFWCE